MDTDREVIARVLDESDPEGGVWRDDLEGEPDFSFWHPQADAILAALPSLGYVKTGEWEYGCANFGDLDDVITVPGPLALQGKTDREWAEGVLQPEYGDILVRRRATSDWLPVPDEGDAE